MQYESKPDFKTIYYISLFLQGHRLGKVYLI